MKKNLIILGTLICVHFFAQAQMVSSVPILLHEYLPAERDIQNFRLNKDFRTVSIIESTDVNCQSISCNSRTSIEFFKVNLQTLDRIQLFSSSNTNTPLELLPIQGDSSAIDPTGQSALIVGQKSYGLLQSNGIDATNSNFSLIGKLYLGASIRYSDNSNMVLYMLGNQDPFVTTPGGQVVLKTPIQNYWHGKFRQGAISPKGTYSVFEQGGHGGHIYFYKNENGQLLGQVHNPGDRTWQNDHLQFVTDNVVLSIENTKIKLYEINDTQIVEKTVFANNDVDPGEHYFHAAGVSPDLSTLVYFTVDGDLFIIDLPSKSIVGELSNLIIHTSNPTTVNPVKIKLNNKREFLISSPKGIQIYKF